jgi:hypothetical protein
MVDEPNPPPGQRGGRPGMMIFLFGLVITALIILMLLNGRGYQT